MRSISFPALALAVTLLASACGSTPPIVEPTSRPSQVVAANPVSPVMPSCDDASRIVVDPYDGRTYFLAFDGDGCSEADMVARYNAAGQQPPIYQLVSQMDYTESDEASLWLYLWVLDAFDDFDDVKRMKKKPGYTSHSAKITARLGNLKRPTVRPTAPALSVRPTAPTSLPAPVPTKAKVASPPPAPAPKPQVCTTYYKTVNKKKVKDRVVCS